MSPQIILDHNDGVIRVQGWVKGTIVTTDPEDAVPQQIVLVGKETTWIYRNGFFSGARSKNKTIHVQPLFEEHMNVTELIPAETNQQDAHEQDTMRPEAEDKNQRVYPFSFYLPHSLPASMHFENHKGGCTIEYALVVKEAETGRVAVQRRIKVIGATLSAKSYPNTVKPTRVAAGPFSSWTGGHFLAAARVTNTHVGKGQYLAVSLSCRNVSNTPILRVNARLVETITWTDTNKCSSQRGKKEAVANNVLAIYNDVTLDGLQTDMIDVADDKEMEKDLGNPCNFQKIRVPLRARDSYRGEMIRIEHSLQVILETREGADSPFRNATSRACLKVPIQVFDPPREVSSRNLVKGATAVGTIITWPTDDAAKLVHHYHELTETGSSCLSIREEEEET